MAPTEMSAVDGSHGEERGKGLEQSIGERRARPDEDKSEPEHQAGSPEEQLYDQGDRAGRRQDGVLALVRLGQTGREDEAHPDAPVDPEAHPLNARWSSREDHRQNDVGNGNHHHDETDDRGDDVHRPVTRISNGGTGASVSSVSGDAHPVPSALLQTGTLMSCNGARLQRYRTLFLGLWPYSPCLAILDEC
jgi:hypothetical protein